MSAEPEQSPLLDVQGLATGYGDLRTVWDATMQVYGGRITALLGRNGAGKTSTLRAICGLNKADAGTVHLGGEDITKLAPYQRVRKGIATVQEGKRVFHRLTVEQNLLLGGYSTRTRRSAIENQIEQIYQLFPILRDKRSLRSGSMSGGQQQMLAIGQALMADPRVLLLDEPSGGLAPVVVGEVMARIAELARSGIGVLLVEQSIEAMLDVADEIVVLDMGRVALPQAPSHAVDEATLREAYLGAGEPRR